MPLQKPKTKRFAESPAPQREILEKTWSILCQYLPKAQPARSYDIDCLAIEGVVVCGLKGFKKHNSYFPFSGSIMPQVKKLPKPCSMSKATLQFSLTEPMPKTLAKKLITLRLKEMASVQHGKRVETYADGSVKAVGKLKHGKMQGKWVWYRRDGSILRTKSFGTR